MIDQDVDWLIKGQYDLQFTPKTKNGACQKEGVYLVATLGRRIKMVCSIPINSIPRCSASAEG